ncbi:hypothetical protein GCM10018793_21590 [Streptomyces sulfonofaciens]|uniref:DUF397 domain-containing protein n=1 Tax=Streptomyces sulfonofaciens TaxID=68272 RepID=A0A919KXI7_9ACTN|nr:DUF397 domain-containing protein [Streptomyces sulfonofaciens]GHH76288.1 hypothetical protein GCM10018793_21590 [Streptomyces sulfonofaciens]
MRTRLEWQKSSFSGGGSGDNCIELATPHNEHRIHLRESEAPDAVLTTAPETLGALITALKGSKIHLP